MTTIDLTTHVASAEARAVLHDDLGLWIDGARVTSTSAEGLAIVDPSTGEEIGRAIDADEHDVDRALAGARVAFDDGRWRRLRPEAKAKRMHRLAELVDAHAPQLAELEALDAGKPITAAHAEVRGAAEMLRYYAGWPTKLHGDLNPTADALLSYTRREPVGVCVGILPWNGPLTMAVMKLGPALACGNAMILKPAEQTNLTTLRLGEFCTEAGIPPGVVQVVTGRGEGVGAALVGDPRVDKIGFTGSTEVGRRIAQVAAGNLTKVSLELGGKSASVVFADADVEALAAALFSPMGVWYNAAQVCFATTRILAHVSIHDELVERARAVTSEIRVGAALDGRTRMGPLVSAEHLERVSSYVDVGRDEGATTLTGGARLETGGYYYPPTLLGDVRGEMRVAREEIFGPVVTVSTFESDEDAVRLAEDTSYGLAAALWTQDLGRAHSIAHALRCGVVWVNTLSELPHSSPVGGYKDSGYGRELGPASLDLYSHLKAVNLRLRPLQH